MMRGCDQTKYGLLMKNLAMEYSLNHDDYPKTMTAATDVLVNYPFDKEYYERKQKQRERNRKQREKEKERKKERKMTKMEHSSHNKIGIAAIAAAVKSIP